MAATKKYNYQSKQEVIDAIKAMREYPRWSEKTSYTQTAEEAVDQAGGDAAGDGRQVRPYMRRAHWRTVVSGKRKAADGSAIPAEKRKRELRWMPPIAVNVDDIGALPAVVRRVK